MASIPPNKLATDLEGIARGVAFKLRLPWRLARLRQAAFEAYQPPFANSGLPSEHTHKTKLERIRVDVRKVGELLEPLPPGVRSLTPEQIETAIGTFEPKQWETLVEDFGQQETSILLEYMDSTATEESRARYERLKREIGAKKLHTILKIVVQRDLELWSENERPMTVPITDPYWADVLRKGARKANRENDGRTTDGKSKVEATSERSIARHFNKKRGDGDRVNSAQVGTWFDKMESLTLEQFLAEKVANGEYDEELDDEQKRAIAFIEYYVLVRKKYHRWPYK